MNLNESLCDSPFGRRLRRDFQRGQGVRLPPSRTRWARPGPPTRLHHRLWMGYEVAGV